jgi:hypothetical protein
MQIKKLKSSVGTEVTLFSGPVDDSTPENVRGFLDRQLQHGLTVGWITPFGGTDYAQLIFLSEDADFDLDADTSLTGILMDSANAALERLAS